MSICPKCPKEIKMLIYYESGYNRYDFSINGIEDNPIYEHKIFTEDNNVYEYVCPECNETLFTDEDEAIKFLKVGGK